MPKEKFNELIIRKQNRYKNKGFILKNHIGFDSETYNGYVKLLCDSTERYKLVNSIEDILDFLTNRNFRNSMNWFYNISYDFDSIIKWLPHDKIIKLYETKEILYDKYFLVYIPKKYFGIKDLNGHYYHYYDLFNFLEISLDNASKKYLHDEKLNIIDAESLNENENYWKDNLDLIITYCLKDAILTGKLAEYFWRVMHETLNFNPKRPFSKGRLAEEYFIRYCDIPIIKDIPIEVLELAYNHYKGGRFELLQRGYFSKVYEYDIKSAYPYQMTKLLDYSKGVWKEVNKYYNTELGFFNCRIKCSEVNISPFVVKLSNVSIYPNGIFNTILTNYEIEAIYKIFPDIEIDILNGYIFNPIQEIHPFKEEINKLYYLKENEKDIDLKYVYKIILNSIYGKTVQVTNGKTGKLFNPIYATLITSNTRLKLLELTKNSQKDVIAFSTDSVHSTRKIKVPNNPKLGDFDFSFEGSGIYVMSDIYTLWNNKKTKSRFRGFMIKENDEKTTLLNILKDNITSNILEYSYNIYRPYHLGECITQNKILEIEDINKWYKETRTIKFNGDKKRVWERDFININDILFNNIQSMPILLT